MRIFLRGVCFTLREKLRKLVKRVFILGDWLNVSRNIEEGSIDLIISDCPFGTELRNNKEFNDSEEYVAKNIDDWMREKHRVLKENHHIYLYVPTLKLSMWLNSFEKYFTLMNIPIAKCYDSNDYRTNNFGFDCQFLLYGTKGEMKNARNFNKVNWIETSEAWLTDKRNKKPKKYTYHYPSYIPRKYRANYKNNAYSKTEHYTEKNRELIEKFILMSSNRGEIVLDCFCGAGNIPLTALKFGRKAIGIEILEKYYNVCKKRYKEFLKNPNLESFI